MGNGCSKRLNKTAPSSNRVIDSTSTPLTITPVQPDKIQHTRSNAPTHSNRIEIGPADRTPSTSSRLETTSRFQSTHVVAATSSNPFDQTDDARSPGRSSVFDSDAFNLSSCIDTTSIIFDKTEPNVKKPSFTRSISVDSSSDKSEKSSESRRFSIQLHRLFKSNQNLTTAPSPSSSSPTPKTDNANINIPKLYHRLSGSVQSLFNSNLSGIRKRNLSASDTNLNRIRSRGGLSQQQLIDNDYCPSVLYNRNARKSYSEKNLDKTRTFSRWKNQLWLKFSRKRTSPSARKS